jgi:hypothetical protein
MARLWERNVIAFAKHAVALCFVREIAYTCQFFPQIIQPCPIQVRVSEQIQSLVVSG